jgi:hypothetical protein
MLRLVSAVLFLCLCPLFTTAQQTTQPKPSREEARALHDRAAAARVIPLRDFEQFAPYWTAEGGWHTDLQLRNNLAADSLTVRPSLRTSDGTETALKPVTLLPGEVRSINLMDALAEINSNLAGQANAYGSIALRYTAKAMRNLYGSVMVHDTGYPVMYHLDAVNQAPAWKSGSREGIWWLPKRSVHDYLILTNQASHPIEGTLYLYDSTGKPWSEPVKLGPAQTQRFSVRDLVRQAGFTGDFGGIRIEMASGAGSLDSVHILYNEPSGFSAT